MSDNKKICLVLPSLSMGGMERVMTQLAMYFYEKKNAKVDLVLLVKREKFYKLQENITIHEPEFNFNEYSQILRTLKTIKYLRATISQINPDTILSFCERYNSFVLLSLVFLNFNVFVSDRASPNVSSGKFIDLVNRYAYKLADGIIAQTQIAKDFLFSRTSHKNIKVIGNPIGFINRKSGTIRENVILNVGRFSENKNQHFLLKYFKEINNLNWKVVFVGDGYKMDEAVKLAKELDLNQNVEFAKPTNEINYYYSKAKIFAFTSTSEGFPNALGEALSTPLACISFDCIAGPAELIEDGINGFLIMERDDKEYMCKLKLLMDNESLRDKFERNAQIKIQKFDINTTGELYYNFLVQSNN